MQQKDIEQIKDMAQIVDNSSVSPKVKEAIRLIISEVLGEANDVHVTMQEVVDSFLRDCRDRGLSPITIKNHEYYGKRLVQLSPQFPPSPETIQQFLADIKPQYALTFYRYWHALGSYAKRKYGIPNFMDKVHQPRVPNEIMPTISDTELDKLAMVLRNASPRNRAIVALFIDTAIRKGEACNLKRRDIQGDRIIVRGKTGYRAAPLSPIVRDLLLSLPVYEDGYVFHGKRGKLTGDGLYGVVKKYLLAAGYQGAKHFGSQTLRRSFGRFHLLDGGDMQSLKDILGHKNISTTAKYYAPLLMNDVIKIHHRHSPGRAFEDVNNEIMKERALGNPNEISKNQIGNDCIHYWILDSNSFGVCKKCGTTKQFPINPDSLDAKTKQKIEVLI